MGKKPRTKDEARRILERAGTISDPPPPLKLLRGKQQFLLEALLQGCNVREAAERAGMSYFGASRAKNTDKFKAALRQARQARIDAATAQLDDLVPLAIRRLGDILIDPAATDADVIKAAQNILDRGGVPKTERLEIDEAPELEEEDVEELVNRLRVIRGGRGD